jgi:ribose-phosphate pyrophosphokinase
MRYLILRRNILENYIILSGKASKHIAEKVVKKLNTELGNIKVSEFSDKEIFVKIEKSIRGKHVFYFQGTPFPANDHLIELLLTLDAIKRSSPASVTLIMPYYGYSRQDRKTESRVAISAKLIADIIQTAGIDRVVTLDIHADQIQGFFNVPVDNLYGASIFLPYLENKVDKNTVIASPDAGGVRRARYFAKKLNIQNFALIDKRREKANNSEVMNVIGEVENKNVIIIDDMVDTAGTLIKAAQAFKNNGAKSVKACITHGVLSGNALNNIKKGSDYLDQLIISNSIYKDFNEKNIKIIDSSDLFSEVVRRLKNNESLSVLWD